MTASIGVGLVVGAGGPTGGPFIHAALDELERATGWQPSSATQIVGTSAGAFVAGSFGPATDPDSEVIAVLSALTNGDDLPATPLVRLLTALRAMAGRLVALVAPGGRPIAEYRVPGAPFHEHAIAVTVEHRSGRRRLHRLAEVADPEAVIRASAAIPGLNGPVPIGKRRHIDGAVHSANNVDVLDPAECPVVVVISPMIPRSGGSIASKFHRAQLRHELRRWRSKRRAAIVIMPSDLAHENRRERDPFAAEGTRAVQRLINGEAY